MCVFRMRMRFSWCAAEWGRGLKERLRALARAECGVAAIYFALSSPVWLGGLAVGAEVGSWFYYQQNLQATADAVALSIAARAGTGPSQAELDNLAENTLRSSRFDFSRSTWEVRLAEPPRESVFVDGSTASVRLTRTVRRYLTGVFEPGDFTIQVAATAQVRQVTEGCILGLRRNQDGPFGVRIVAGNVQVNGCEVLSNGSTFLVVAGSRLAADCARSAQGFFIEGTLDVACQNGQPVREAGLTLDPYFALPDLDPSMVPACSATEPVTITQWSDWQDRITPTVIDGRRYALFCPGATLTVEAPVAGGTINVPDWTFLFDGSDFELRGGTNLVGAGVSFNFFGGGRPLIDAAGSAVRLSADASGMLFRGAKTNSLPAGQANRFAFGPGSHLQGAIYFPASEVVFEARGSLDGCPQIIGSAVTLTGGTWQLNGPCGAPGVLPIVASRVVNLTQ